MVEASVMILSKHVTFLSYGSVFIKTKQESVVCESGLVWMLLQDRLSALGWVQDETGAGVYMLSSCRSKRGKSVWCCRDRWTERHMKSRACKQADTLLQIKCPLKMKGRDGCWSVSLCVWETTLYGQKYVDNTVNIILCSFTVGGFFWPSSGKY